MAKLQRRKCQQPALVCTLHASRVQTLALGDGRDRRQRVNYVPKANQRIHQMVTGQVRWMITDKVERLGMRCTRLWSAPVAGIVTSLGVETMLAPLAALASIAMASTRLRSGANVWAVAQSSRRWHPPKSDSLASQLLDAMEERTWENGGQEVLLA